MGVTTSQLGCFGEFLHDLFGQAVPVGRPHIDRALGREVQRLAGEDWISLDGRIQLSLQAKRDQMAEAALFKKDPDAYQAKMEAMEAARMRMQARHDEVSELHYK